MAFGRFFFLLLIIMVLTIPGQAGKWDGVFPRWRPAPPERLLPWQERRAFIKAYGEAKHGRLVKARRAISPFERPVAEKAIEWVGYRAPRAARHEQIALFLDQNPNWPSQSLLRLRAEEAISSRVDLQARLDWFAEFPPRTGEGHVAYALALKEAGRLDDAITHIRQGWRKVSLSRARHKNLLRQWRAHLTVDDHIARANHLLWQRRRSQAHRMLPLLPADQKKLVEARIALIGFAWAVDAAVGAVPDHLKNHTGLVYDRTYWRRVKRKYDSATELMAAHIPDGRLIERPDRWWRERHLLARRALRQNQIDDAYRLASEHGLIDRANADTDPGDLPRRTRAAIAEAEWLAGWIALRFQNRPGDALDHFKRVYEVVRYPISIARAAYWAGRAAEARNDPVAASAWYQQAADHPSYYYGQLALSRLGTQVHQPSLDETSINADLAVDDQAALEAFMQSEQVLAARYLLEFGADREFRQILSHLAVTADSPEKRQMVFQLSDSLGRPDAGLAAAKQLAQAGMGDLTGGYPQLAVPPQHRPRQPLIQAIARQESAFDPRAKSSAGALGLMQLTPATAAIVARREGLSYSRQRLTSDADYNLDLGSAHIAQLLRQYKGSYVLALAAYNAGSRPVNRWLRDNGDPRDPSIDVVDWVEQVPYSETRNYIQRVLEAATVYAGQRTGHGRPPSLTDLLLTGRGPGDAALLLR